MDALAINDPCHYRYKPTNEELLQSFKDSWNYMLAYKPKQIDACPETESVLIDKLAGEAYNASKMFQLIV